MEHVSPFPPVPIHPRSSPRQWRHTLVILIAAYILLFIAVLTANVESLAFILSLVIALVAGAGAFVFVVAQISRQVHHEQAETKVALQGTKEAFRRMAGNIQEVFWTIDAKTGTALYVNEAYEALTGRSCRSLMDKPSAWLDLIPPEDRPSVLAKLTNAIEDGRFDQQLRIMRPDGEIRWVWVRGELGCDGEGKIARLVGSALDITAQKNAEEQVTANLEVSKSSLVEEEALRKATLALTQDLHMNNVMDALLASLGDVVPYSCARVLVQEGGPHWLALGERNCPASANAALGVPWTFIDDKCALVRQLAKDKTSLLIPDTKKEPDWPTFKGHKHLRSWISVPLISSKQYLGFVSVGHIEPNKFTAEHLRRAELLAVPVAIAIENARLYTQSEIFASELTKRTSELQAAESALVHAEGGQRTLEQSFHKLFHSSPVPFWITTYKEGKVVDVNAAFESRYGYSRDELLGRRIRDIGIWGDTSDLDYLLACLEKVRHMRNVVTPLRAKTGEIKITTYSADAIEFKGQACILAISEDVLQCDPRKAN
jgi:PAS domain S-box-containing protein